MGARVFCTVFKCIVVGLVVIIEADRQAHKVRGKKS